MPAASFPSLGTIAIEYLRHHDELEAARTTYLEQRNALLDALGSRMNELAQELRLPVSTVRREDKTGAIDLYLDGAYVRRRAQGGDKRSSGMSVHVGRFDDKVSAVATLWFHMKVTAPKSRVLELAALAEKPELRARIIGEGMYLYLVTHEQPAATVDVALLEQAAAALPEQFKLADAWIAQRYPL